MDLDFTAPPPKPTFDTKVALKYFKASGSPLEVAAGTTLFAEGDKANALFFQRDNMYFLAEGEVELAVGNAAVATVRSGDIFGEMTLITRMPRTATAKAKTACRLYTLDKDQLHSALASAPEFGLLLMSIMITRLRDVIAAVKDGGMTTDEASAEDAGMFDKKLLDKLVEELDDNARMPYLAKRVIMEEGQSGVMMYVVLDGLVEIAIHGNAVATIGPGGMFGEMALITRGERLASAVAKTDCMLLAISRNVFLDLVCSNPKFAVSLLGAVGNRARQLAALRV